MKANGLINSFYLLRGKKSICGVIWGFPILSVFESQINVYLLYIVDLKNTEKT